MTGTAYRVAALFRYPLKSAAGVRCDEVELDRYGVRDDRRWMMIDDAGRPLTQREHPPLALLHASPTEDGLAVRWTGPDAVPSFVVRRPARTACRRPVTIWGDTVHLPVADLAASEWLSSVLGRDAHFAWMPGDVERPVNPRYARPEDRTTLTDGYPLHLVGAGSMADLNGRLETPVGVERFRPNIYIEGPPAFDEDDWAEVRIGNCTLRVVKPCPRCTVTTVDPSTGTRGKEPLRTLSGYRQQEAGVMFGQNALHDGTGTMHVGDPVEIVSRRDAPAG